MRLHDPCAMVLESRIWKGQQGEQWAVAHLERLGHRILARNWRWRRSELDIVSRHGDTTVFVEVKCRSRCGDTTDPRQWMPSDGQQRRLIQAAHAFQQSDECPTPRLRFDVVLVRPRHAKPWEVVHFQDAFDSTALHPRRGHPRLRWRSLR